MTIKSANPNTLRTILAGAQPGDTIVLEPGAYAGEYGTPTAGKPDAPITVAGPPDAIFTGGNTPLSWTINAPHWRLQDFSIEPGTDPRPGQKPTWVAVRSAGSHAQLHQITMRRDGDIADAKRWNDFGIVVEGPHTLITAMRMYGMTKPIHVKGPAIGVTIKSNHIGPAYQSCIVMGSSLGVMRQCLIAFNVLEGSYIEDAIQFMPNYDAANVEADISNLGTIIYHNIMRDCGENAIDLKGAGFVVIDGNLITHMAGSNDGPVNGWNFNALNAIGRGARTSCRQVIIRNNRLLENAAGIRLLPTDWHIYHNQIDNNNWRPEIDNHRGYGIRQPGGAPGASARNNLIHSNLDGDLIVSGIDEGYNRPTPGPGGPLTSTRAGGSGRIVPVHRPGFFSAWYGRTDLPPERIVIGEHVAHVVSVDYNGRTVTIDRDLTWKDGAPICYGSGSPMVGPLKWDDMPEPVEPETPPIVVEPPTEPVEPEPQPEESITLTGPPASVAMLRAMIGAFGNLSISD